MASADVQLATLSSALSDSNRPGHGYGPINISDHAIVHMGDSVTSLTDMEALQRLARQERVHEEQRKREIQDVLRGLSYDGMDMRRRELELVANKMASVDWIWETNFKVWLQEDQPLFFASGKPGSGKSTLMKYLASAPETSRCLSYDRHQWIIAEFYFDFNATSKLANTTIGMLRSLLLQLVSKVNTFGDFIRDQHGHLLNGDWLESETELMNTMCGALKSQGAKLCVFIDGIDEYRGELRDVILCLRTMRDRVEMKMCIASRPDAPIRRMLGSAPSLRIEDHNAATITSYINSECVVLTSEEAQATQFLWQHVEHEANGVILWTRFVVDELVSGIIAGATNKELQETLQLFSTGMEEVYKRVLQGLTDEQRLHAAIAFYTIRQGGPLLSSGKDLPVYEFFITWVIMVELLDQEAEFDHTFDIKRFEYRIQAMLGGLLEFSDRPQAVRLIHSTLEAYLDRSDYFDQMLTDLVKPLCHEGIPAQTFVSVIRQANEELLIDHLSMSFSNAEGRDAELSSTKLLKYLRPKDINSHVSHRLQYLLNAVERFAYALPDSPEYAQTIWSTVRSEVFRLHPHICKDLGCICAEKLDRRFFEEKPFWRDKWSLRYLASHGLYCAFEYGIKELKEAWVSWAIEDLLGMVVDIVRNAQLGTSLVAATLEPSRRQHNPFRLRGHRLIEILLDGVRIQPHHIAIYQTIDFPKEPQFISRVRNTLSPITLKHILHCSWFQHEKANLLCSWAWYSDDCYDRDIQASRLKCLLGMGLAVNRQAYSKGTVMHALFDHQEVQAYHAAVTHNEAHHVLWPFSRVKFDLLIDAGYKIVSSTGDNNILFRARQFRKELKRRTACTILQTEASHKLREFDDFVSLILEPICTDNIRPSVRATLEPETPVVFTQQDTEYHGFVMEPVTRLAKTTPAWMV